MTATTDHATSVRDKLYIGGEWVSPAGAGKIEVVNPTTEEPLGSVPEGSAQDVERAVEAAREAFPSWSQTSVQRRAESLQAIADGIGERMDEIAALIAHEVGMPVKLARMIQAGLPRIDFASMPQVMERTPWEEEVGNSLVVREPIGVVGAITPWNYPLHQIAAKVAPALAAGCTVVVKPSEVAPLTAFVLAEIIDERRAPRGRVQSRDRLRPGGGGGARRPPRTST